MAHFNTMQSPLLFEELEPRLLFSADIAAAIAVDVVEQDYSEEPVVTVDLETVADAGDVAADSPAEEEVAEPVDAEDAAPADSSAADEVSEDEEPAGQGAAAPPAEETAADSQSDPAPAGESGTDTGDSADSQSEQENEALADPPAADELATDEEPAEQDGAAPPTGEASADGEKAVDGETDKELFGGGDMATDSADSPEEEEVAAPVQEEVAEPVDAEDAAPADSTAADRPEADEEPAGQEVSALAKEETAADSQSGQATGRVGETDTEEATGGDAAVTAAGEDADSSGPADRKELVFVNDDVQDCEQLADDLRQGNSDKRTVEVVILDDDLDGIEQVTETLNNRNDLDAIHFFSHGSEGSLSLGSGWLDNAGLLANSDAISSWGRSMAADADILVYGCNIAAGEEGRNLTGTLAQLTGADVAASVNNTGSLNFGGNWTLEYSSGTVEVNLVITPGIQQQWQGLLAAGDTPPVVVTSGPALAYTAGDPAVAIDPTATVVDVDSPNFHQGTLTVSLSAGGTMEDELLVVEGGNVTLVNQQNHINIKVGVNLVGSFEEGAGSGGTPLVISWTPQATPDSAQEVLRQIAFRNTSDNPSTDPRTVDFVITDGDGGISSVAQQLVNVIAAGDAPSGITLSGTSVDENIDTTAGHSVATLATMDADSFVPFTYSIAGGSEAALFSIGGVGADELILRDGVLDYETTASYSVIVRSTDDTARSFDQAFTISVIDLNEFAVGAVSDTHAATNAVAEDAASGTPVGITALATDADGTATVSYSLSDNAGGRFAIDAHTGVITVAQGLDYETATGHSVTVLATSSDMGASSQSFAIAVSDVNEFAVGPVSDANAGINTVAEDAASGTPVGITALAIDADGTATVSYTLSDNAGGRFAIDAHTGVITVAQGLDYETAANYSVTVSAASSDTGSSSQVFTILVGDINDTAPPVDDPVVPPPVDDPVVPPPVDDPVVPPPVDDPVVPLPVDDPVVPPPVDDPVVPLPVDDPVVPPPVDDPVVPPPVDDPVVPPPVDDPVVPPPVDEPATPPPADEAVVPPPAADPPPSLPLDQEVHNPGIGSTASAPLAVGIDMAAGNDQAQEQTLNQGPLVAENSVADEVVVAGHPAETVMTAGNSLADAGQVPATDRGADSRADAGQPFSSPQKPARNDQQFKEETHVGIVLKTIRAVVRETFDFIASPVAAAPLYPDSPSPYRAVTTNEIMQQQIDAMHWEIDQASEKSGEENSLVLYSASGVSVSVTAGVVSYLLRSGSLMSSFLATVPLWKGFDPVAILNTPISTTGGQSMPNPPKGKSMAEAVTENDQQAEDLFTE